MHICVCMSVPGCVCMCLGLCHLHTCVALCVSAVSVHLSFLLGLLVLGGLFWRMI